MPDEQELNKGFRLGEWTVLPSRGVLRRDEQEERPEPLVFGLLIELAKRDGDLVTKDELVDALWDGRPIGDTPITRAVYELRKHLDDRERPYRYVETLKRRGYRLMQAVEPLVEEAPPIEETVAAPRRQSSPFLRGVVILIFLAFAGLIVWYNDGRKIDDCTAIEVEPFESYGSSADQRWLAYGFREELLKTLLTVPELCVVAAQSDADRAMLLPLSDRPRLDAVLSGGVQNVGGSLKVSYELVDADSGDVLATGSETGELSDLFDLQVAIAESVRQDLLPASAAVLMSATRPADFDAYQDYLRGLYAFERRGTDDNFERAIAYFESTIERDPAFGPAYVQLAMAIALAPVYGDAPADVSFERAIAVVEEGIAVDASIEPGAGAVFGYIFHQRKQWAEAELAFERAISARVLNANAFAWYSRMLASVGRLDASLEQAIAAWQLDPDNAVLNSRLALAYAWVGETGRASEFFERSEELGARGSTHLLGYALHLAGDGDLDRSAETARLAVSGGDMAADWIDTVIAGIEDPANAGAALEAVDAAVASGGLTAQVEVVTRTLLGDIDGAMRVARMLEAPGEAFEMDLLWIPPIEPLRRHPGFEQLTIDLGLSDYWSTKGCRLEETLVRCPDD